MVEAPPDNLAELGQIIMDCEIACPISGTRNDGCTPIQPYVQHSTGHHFRRGEHHIPASGDRTGIFVNNVQKSARMKVPWNSSDRQSFRNEIVARQFIFRMRSEQMEKQFFVRPGSELEWFEKWKEARLAWHKALGLGDEKYRYHDHDKLAHYANAATDIEFEFPFGFKELEGIHSRTDFDLAQHQQFSGRKMQYFDPETGESYVPYVVETSIGLDRTFLAILSAAYCEEKLENGEERVVLRIPPAIAPVKLAVLPLVRKDSLPRRPAR